MKIADRIRLILRKYPETKFDRAEFFWRYMEEYHGVTIYALKKQFKEFWKTEATTERILREILKEKEFQLPPKQEQLRYSKASEFQQEYKPN